MATDPIVIRGKILGVQLTDVLVLNGVVQSVERPNLKRKADIGGPDAVIAPTLFDIQVNGGGGLNLQGGEVTPETVVELDAWMMRNGVSHWIPTIITGDTHNMERGCRVIAEVLQDRKRAKRILGVHLEGPYISPVDGPRGAHQLKHVRVPDKKEFARWMKAADGKVAYMTLAPEVEGAIPFIKYLVKQGIVVSLGHHQADADTIKKAADAGATLCTHLGNGLSPTINRHHNPLWPQLCDDRLYASLIADLHHLPEAPLKIFARVKGPDRTILTSDCVHITGLPPGDYDLGGSPVELTPQRRINLKGTSLLAGSALMLLEGVVNTARVTDFTLGQAFEAATTTPAKLFGKKPAFLAVWGGQKANFLVYEVNRNRPAIQAVYVDGVACT